MASFSGLVVLAGTLGQHKHDCGKDLRRKLERGAEDTSPAAIDAHELWLLTQLPPERAFELLGMGTSIGVEVALAEAKDLVASMGDDVLCPHWRQEAPYIQIQAQFQCVALLARARDPVACGTADTLQHSVAWQHLETEIKQCQHLALCVASLARWPKPVVDAVASEARDALVLSEATPTAPDCTAFWKAHVLPSLAGPTFVTVIGVACKSNTTGHGVKAVTKMVSKLHKLVASTTGAVMARHWVLWAGDHGVPINLLHLFGPDLYDRDSIDMSHLFEPDSYKRRSIDLRHLFEHAWDGNSSARTWAATAGAWLAANGVVVAATDSTVHIATSNQAIVVVSWHAESHHSLVRRVVGECHQRKWGMVKRVHAKLPQLPASVAAALTWLAAFQVDADVLYTILRMLLCFEPVEPRKETESAPKYPRNLAVESLERDYGGSILEWLSFHNFGSKATGDDTECEGMALSKALFPPQVHSGLVEQWRRVQCHGPALDFFEYLLLVEVMSG